MAIEKIKSIVLDDIEYYKINRNDYLPKMLEKVLPMIRQTETPDYHIPDINAMIGCYLDEAEFYQKDFEWTKQEFKNCIDKYIKMAFIFNEEVVMFNIEKLKNYDGDDSIFG
jgi:hypothetical protein